MDFAEWKSEHLLVITDVCSKLISSYTIRTRNAEETIKLLEKMFNVYRLPMVFRSGIITGNDPPFQSHQFKMFCKSRGIRLMHSPVFHFTSNGLSGKCVQTVKSALTRK